MKNLLTSAIAVIMAISMAFCLTSCGGPSDEQTAEIENLLTKYESLVKQCETESAKYPAIDDESYTKSIKEFVGTVAEIKQLAADTRTAYNESKDNYTPEDADNVIASLKNQVENCENLLTQIKDNVEEVKNAMLITG